MSTTLDMNTVDNILSYVPLSVQAKINKPMYDKIAKIAINKIISFIRYHRNRMNEITEFGFGLNKSMSQELIRAYYILYYPKEHIDTYCQFALNKITRRMSTAGILFKNLLEDNQHLNSKKLFNKMINNMHKNWILFVGW